MEVNGKDVEDISRIGQVGADRDHPVHVVRPAGPIALVMKIGAQEDGLITERGLTSVDSTSKSTGRDRLVDVADPMARKVDGNSFESIWSLRSAVLYAAVPWWRFRVAAAVSSDAVGVTVNQY